MHRQKKRSSNTGIIANLVPMADGVLGHFEGADVPDEPWASIRQASPDEYGKYVYPDYPKAKSPATLAKFFRKTEPDYYAAVRQHIAEHGVQEPMLLRYKDPGGRVLKRPVVMGGHHRAAAAWELGQSLPVGDYDNPEHYGATSDFAQQWWRDHQDLKAQYADPRSRTAAARPGRGQKTCLCCKGGGSHGDGSECDQCDESGLLHSDEEQRYCPGQPQPRRRHWRQPVAGANGPMPEDMEFRHQPNPYMTDQHLMTAHHGGRQVGYLEWGGPEGFPPNEVQDVSVDDGYRRRGIASEMLRRAREISPGLGHSSDLSDDAGGWAAHDEGQQFRAARGSFETADPEAQRRRFRRAENWLDRNTRREDDTVDIPAHWGHQVSNQVIHGILDEHGWPRDESDREDHWSHIDPENIPVRQAFHHHQGFVHPETVKEKMAWSSEGSMHPDDQPAKVVRHQGKTYLLDGHHKWVGARLLGHEGMEAHVFDTSRPETYPQNCPECSEDDDDDLMSHFGALPGDGYGYEHRPLESGTPLHEGGGLPESARQRYAPGEVGDWDEAVAQFRHAQGNPDHQVRIYRAAPHKSGGMINRGDWVSRNPAYAHRHGYGSGPGGSDWPVYTAEVHQKHVHWDENDEDEHGYNGPEIWHPDVHDEETGELHDWDSYHDAHPHGREAWIGSAVHMPQEDHEFVHDQFEDEEDRANRLLGHAHAQGALHAATWRGDNYEAMDDAVTRARQIEPPAGHRITMFHAHRKDDGRLADVDVKEYDPHADEPWRGGWRTIDTEETYPDYSHQALDEAGHGHHAAAAQEVPAQEFRAIPLYHGSPHEFRPGDLLTPEGSLPHSHDQWDNPDHKPGEYVYTSRSPASASNAGNEHPGALGMAHVYQVEHTGPAEPDHVYDANRGQAGINYKTRHPVRVLRKVDDWTGEEPEEALRYLQGGGIRPDPKTAALDPPGEPLINPYHGTSEFGGRPEWAHTWFHGTRGDEPAFGNQKPIERERGAGMSWEQPNKYLGVHFSPLHGVAHNFAHGVFASGKPGDDRYLPGVPSSLVHAELHFRNPAHFPTENHLNLAVAQWASQHYPGWHDDKLNDSLGWKYSDQEGTHRDWSTPSDPDKVRRLGNHAQTVLQWHPHLPEITRGFGDHLRATGHEGIIYGNMVEGPGGFGLPLNQPKSFSAIATHPDQIRPVHTEHIAAPFFGDPPELKPGQVTHPQSGELNEPEDMEQRIIAYHSQHQGELPRKLAAAAPAPEYGPRPEYQTAPEGSSDDEEMAHFDQQREIKRNWDRHIQHGLSVGHLTAEQAGELGYRPSGHATESGTGRSLWQPLPHEMYHVTTDLPGVQAHGLKTRAELAQSRGHGLGGGEDDTISVTTDHELAGHILHSLHEFHDVVNGRLTPQQMWDQARRGDGASRPWHTDLAGYWDRSWNHGDQVPRGLEAQLRGVETKQGGLLYTPEEMNKQHGPGWRPHRDADTFKGAHGQDLYNVWERDLDPDQRREQAADFYKNWAAFRQHAGGRPDPMFFSTDTKAFAAKDPRNFAILHVRPKPGAQGYPVGSMSEWRTGSGDALEVHHAERAPGRVTSALAAPASLPQVLAGVSDAACVAGLWMPETPGEMAELLDGFPAFFGALADGLDILGVRLDDCPVDEHLPAIARSMASACRMAAEDAEEVNIRVKASFFGGAHA